MDGEAPAVDPLDEVRVMDDPSNPDAALVWLPEFTHLDTQAWSLEVGIPRSLIPGLVAALDAADATDPLDRAPADETLPQRLRQAVWAAGRTVDENAIRAIVQALGDDHTGLRQRIYKGHVERTEMSGAIGDLRRENKELLDHVQYLNGIMGSLGGLADHLAGLPGSVKHATVAEWLNATLDSDRATEDGPVSQGRRLAVVPGGEA